MVENAGLKMTEQTAWLEHAGLYSFFFVGFFLYLCVPVYDGFHGQFTLE